MINVLADKHLYKITNFVPSDVTLTLFDSNTEPYPKIPPHTDAVLIRTVTKINPETYPTLPPNLSFAGTGSAGFDHVDQPYLQNNGITFTHAPGCNARSVAEYITVALLLWAEEYDKPITSRRVGIIGVGQTGGEVQKLLHNLNIETIGYDPPRQEREPGFQSAALNEVLNCDILTFHTPLTNQAPYPTYHWLDNDKLREHSFSLIINASRGGVIDESALLNAYQNRTVENYILDVWENEPNFNDNIARNAFIKTPHIAGYSIQAKERATALIVKAMNRHFSIEETLPEISEPAAHESSPSTFWSLTDALTYYHPIEDYKTRLMMLVGRSSKDKMAGFNNIRTHHPLRNELKGMSLPAQTKQKFAPLQLLTE